MWSLREESEFSRVEIAPFFGRRKPHEQCRRREAKSRGEKKAWGGVVVAEENQALSSRNRTAFWVTKVTQEVWVLQVLIFLKTPQKYFGGQKVSRNLLLTRKFPCLLTKFESKT